MKTLPTGITADKYNRTLNVNWKARLKQMKPIRVLAAKG